MSLSIEIVTIKRVGLFEVAALGMASLDVASCVISILSFVLTLGCVAECGALRGVLWGRSTR